LLVGRVDDVALDRELVRVRPARGLRELLGVVVLVRVAPLRGDRVAGGALELEERHLDPGDLVVARAEGLRRLHRGLEGKEGAEDEGRTPDATRRTLHVRLPGWKSRTPRYAEAGGVAIGGWVIPVEAPHSRGGCHSRGGSSFPRR